MTLDGRTQASLGLLRESKPDFFRPPFGFEPLPLTGELVESTEQALGKRLPDLLVAILSIQNGGTPRYGGYGNEVNMETWLGMGPADRVPNVSLSESERWIGDYGPAANELVKTCVLLEYDAHYCVALDYRQSGSEGDPSVILFWPEEFDAEKRIQPVADNLAQFVDGLYPTDTEYTFGFTGSGEDRKPLQKAIEKAFDVKLKRMKKPRYPQPGERDQPGYAATLPAWVRWLPGSSEPAEIRLLRNRHADPEWLEFPQHPECEWTLVCDMRRDHEPEFRQRLESLDYSVIDLHVPHWDRLGW